MKDGIIHRFPVVGIYEDKEKGLVTRVEGMPLFKGRIADGYILSALAGAKSCIALTLFFLTRTPIFPLFLIRPLREQFRYRLAMVFHKSMGDVWEIGGGNWSRSGKELYRAMGTLPEFQGDDTIYDYTVNNKYRLMLVSLWEYDDAYRFRGQDLLSEMRWLNLIKPRKEFLRLLDIAIKREGYEELKSKYRMLKWVVRFTPHKYLRKVADVLYELDIKKMLLDEDDLMWGKLKNYNYGGKDYWQYRGQQIEPMSTEPLPPSDALNKEEMDAFNADLKALCEKHNVKLDIITDPKLQVSKRNVTNGTTDTVK